MPVTGWYREWLRRSWGLRPGDTGLIRGITVHQPGDDPAVEPRGLLVRVLLQAGTAQPYDHPEF